MKWINYLEKEFPVMREVAVKWGTQYFGSYEFLEPRAFGHGETDYLFGEDSRHFKKADIYWLDETEEPEYVNNSAIAQMHFDEKIDDLKAKIEALPRYTPAPSPPFIGIPAYITYGKDQTVCNLVMIEDEKSDWVQLSKVIKLLQ